VIELDPDGDLEPLAGHMRTLAAAGEGWINLHPGVDENSLPPPRSAFGGLVGARGPDVPLCTWTAPTRGRRPEPAMAGVQHASGPKAVATLAAAGLPVPAAWRVTQDHPRRGLVLALPDDTDCGTVLQWLVRAAEILSPVPLLRPWHAAIHAAR
jgi:hypothetical protein